MAVSDLAGLDLKRLRTLERVARHGSFSAAAAELHFTQSAVSQQIAALERELGTRLVHRNPVVLTDAGAALCRRYETVLAELAAARAELDAFREGGSGRLRIACSTGTAAGLLPRALAVVSRNNPGVDVWVTSLGRAESLAAARRGDADLAVTHRFDASSTQPMQIHETRLLCDQLTLAVPAGHRLASRSAVRLSDLSEESWISVPDLDVPRTVTTAALQGAAATPVAVVANGDLHGAQALVAAGVGVTFVPELDQRHDMDVVHVPIADTRVGRSIFAARVTAATDGVVQEMLRALVGVARGIWPRLIAGRTTGPCEPEPMAITPERLPA